MNESIKHVYSFISVNDITGQCQKGTESHDSLKYKKHIEKTQPVFIHTDSLMRGLNTCSVSSHIPDNLFLYDQHVLL